MKVTVVVPTIREECINKFLKEWEKELKYCRIIVVEDNPTRTFKLPKTVEHYSWKEIDADLGKNSWIIPRRTDCVRSYGFLKAYQDKPDICITLDDDCYPSEANFVEKHISTICNLVIEGWQTTANPFPRGFPYSIRKQGRPVVLNIGLWEGVPDFDAVTQLRGDTTVGLSKGTAGRGIYIPMCGMNVAFRSEVIPALYFLLMGKDYPYDRFGDIWAGIFLKKIADHLGYYFSYGHPHIFHSRASNVWANLRKEAAGMEVNETLWQEVDKVKLTKTNFKDCYIELAQKLPLKGEYWGKLKKAMQVWANLF